MGCILVDLKSHEEDVTDFTDHREIGILSIPVS